MIKTFKPNLVICDLPIISDNWFKYFYYQNVKTLEICNSQKNLNLVNISWLEVYPKGLNQKKNRSDLITLSFHLHIGLVLKKTGKKIRNILVTFGGCDHLRLTEKIIKMLNSIKEKLFIKVVIGKFYKNVESSQKILKNQFTRFYY